MNSEEQKKPPRQRAGGRGQNAASSVDAIYDKRPIANTPTTSSFIEKFPILISSYICFCCYNFIIPQNAGKIKKR